MTIDPASGVVLEKVGFPVPKTFDDGVVRYVGYDKPVAFPLTLKRVQGTGDVTLRASVFLGICEDICIPVQGELTLALKEGDFDNPLDSARIEDAVALLPEAPSKDFAVTASHYDAERTLLRLSVHLPGGADHPELFWPAPPGFPSASPRSRSRARRASALPFLSAFPARTGNSRANRSLSQYAPRAAAWRRPLPLIRPHL